MNAGSLWDDLFQAKFEDEMVKSDRKVCLEKDDGERKITCGNYSKKCEANC